MEWNIKQYFCFVNKWSKQKNIWLLICVYTVLFLITFLFAYGPFLFENKTFILHSDGVEQHYPLLVYMGRALRRVFFNAINGKFTVPLFSISSGLGDDLIGLLNSLGRMDPLVLFSALIPAKCSEYFYCFLCVFRLYLAGVSFIYLCLYFNKKALYTLIGTIVYVYSGYGYSSAIRHPYFVNPMIILPLLIIGTEKILKREKPYTFILSVAYAVICGFYHLYMMTLMIFIYALVRFFDLYHVNRLKEFIYVTGRGMKAFCLGIGISAMVFFPSIAEFFYGSRSGFSNYTPVEYNWKYFRNRILRMFAPTPNATGLIYPSFAAIAFFALILLFFTRKKHSIKRLTFIAFLFFWIDLGGLIMNGFQYSSPRWTFGLALIVAFAVVEMLPELMQLTSKQQILCFVNAAAYVCLFFSTDETRRLTYISIGAIFIILTLLVLTASVPERDKVFLKVDKQHVTNYPHKEQTCRAVACLLLVVVNVAIDNFYKAVPDQGNLIGGYTQFGKTNANLIQCIERELEPYLLNNPSGRVDSSLFKKNTAIVWNIPGMLVYSSVANRNITDYWREIECVGSYSAFNYASTDQRTIANTLLSQKYHVEPQDRIDYIPYGYIQIAKTKKENLIFENNYALPWGYTYDTVVSYSDLDDLNGIQKQECMLQAIALEEITKNANIDTFLFNERIVPYDIEYKNCIWENGLLNITKANATITLQFSMPADVEEYVRLIGLEPSDSKMSEFDIRVSCNNVSKFSRVLPPSSSYYFGRKNYLFNLGYSEKERNTLTITFPFKGTFKLDNIKLYALPMDNYINQVENLRAESLENIQWGTNEISGTINLSKNKILCMSIPYSKGWSAKVDGEEVEILCGNYMFMALPLTKGYHEVEFNYCSPGLKIGLAVSIFSAVILLLLILHDRKLKSK